MKYKIYLDKDEKFECESQIRNASYTKSKARLIIGDDDKNIIFEGKVNKNNIEVPIKSNIIRKLFKEDDQANIKLEVIVENTILEPWASKVKFESYNKVEINEIKNVSIDPHVSVKIKNIDTDSNLFDGQTLLEHFNSLVKRSNVKLSKEEKLKLFKKVISQIPQ